MSDPKSLVTALSRGPCPSLPRLAGRYLEEYLGKIEHSVGRLDESQIWWRPSPGSNSVGNLLLHLAGNLSFWILEGLGARSIERHRSAEFKAEGTHDRRQLLSGLRATVDECLVVLAALEGEELTDELSLQGYAVDRLGALFHAVEHMSYHTGQIVAIVKQLDEADERLEFYPQHADE